MNLCMFLFTITILFQILMSVYLVRIIAVVMPYVPTLLEALLASVKLDLLEMELLVVVGIYDFFFHLQVS